MDISNLFTQPDLQVGIILVLLASGILCLLAGLIVLLTRGFSSEMKTLAATSTELSKQAITHDLTALAESASEILNLINQMMKTAAGAGAFLVMVGVALMSVAYWLTNSLA
jgi:hypothetical protein